MNEYVCQCDDIQLVNPVRLLYSVSLATVIAKKKTSNEKNTWNGIWLRKIGV